MFPQLCCLAIISPPRCSQPQTTAFSQQISSDDHTQHVRTLKHNAAARHRKQQGTQGKPKAIVRTLTTLNACRYIYHKYDSHSSSRRKSYDFMWCTRRRLESSGRPHPHPHPASSQCLSPLYDLWLACVACLRKYIPEQYRASKHAERSRRCPSR